MTPFEVLVGVKMRRKEDLELMRVLDEEVQNKFTEERYELRKVAKDNIAELQEENRRQPA